MSLVGALGGVERGTSEIVQRIAPSVVEIRNGHGIGAGVIWRSDGLIVTNDHVAQSDRVTVTLWDGRQLAGSVIARDQHNDLAIVSVAERSLPAAQHRAHAVRPGELALAVGHPFGERYSAAVGIIATAARSGAAGDRHLIQADVPLGPGSSGGPLLDANGLVVGINSMVGGGMALAIPSRFAEALVQAVISLAAA
jgi:serine protease Do